MCVWAVCVGGWGQWGLVCWGRLRGMRVVLVVGGVWGRGSVGGGIKDEGKPETKSTAALADKGNAIRRATLNATHASAVWPPPFTFFNPPPPLHPVIDLLSTPGGRTKTSCSSLTIFSSLFGRFLLRVVVVCFFSVFGCFGSLSGCHFCFSNFYFSGCFFCFCCRQNPHLYVTMLAI